MRHDALDNLATKKFILVTGKGGSGKSLLSIALAHRLSLQGRKVFLAEIGRKRDKAFSRLPELLGVEKLEHEPTKVALEGSNPIYASVLEPAKSLAEYVDLKLPTGGLAGLLLNNKVTASFLEVVPGLPDLVALGKLWYSVTNPKDNLYPDCVILDAPATGHAISLLKAPQNFKKITKTGPIFRDAEMMSAFFEDPNQSAIAITTLPEEMSLQETLETKKILKGFPEPIVFVNKCFPKRKRIAKLSSENIMEKAYLYSLQRHDREQESLEILKEKFLVPFYFPDPKSPPLYQKIAEALGNEL